MYKDMSVTREATPSRVNLAFSVKKKARNGDWEVSDDHLDSSSAHGIQVTLLGDTAVPMAQ